MRWHHQTNYHGSREYASDAAERVVVGQLRLTLAFLLDAARRRFNALLGRAAPPTSTTILKMGDRRGFTVLGLPGFDADQPDASAAPWASPKRVEERIKRDRGYEVRLGQRPGNSEKRGFESSFERSGGRDVH